MILTTSHLMHDHVELRRVLEQVRIEGIGTEIGRKTLQAARTLFVEHIRQEDQDFYPAYRNVSRNHPRYAATADEFADEMTELGAQVLAFFDKYRDGGSGLEFARDFGRMHAMLQSRLRKEEAILYARFEDMQADAMFRKSA